MRPVTRPPAPAKYKHYKDAIGDLENCFGRYCSYCERRILVSLAVEHVSPKDSDPGRETDWTNFLLACPNCNSAKGTTVTNTTDYLWPDLDNTLLALSYEEGGIVSPSSQIDPTISAKAAKLIDLLGLDRHPGQPPEKRPADRDLRYHDREEAWKLAKIYKQHSEEREGDFFREIVIDLAIKTGFFSIWASTFADDKYIIRRLIETHKGTSLACFDDDWTIRIREGSHI